MYYLAIALFSALLALVLVVLARKLFPKWGLMDRPLKYGLKRAPIPYYGGIVIVLAFLVSTLYWLPWDPKLLAFLGMGLLVAIVSFWDDYRGIKPVYRLLLQVTMGAGLFFSGVAVLALPNPIGAEIGLGTVVLGGVAVLSLLATILWVVLIMNTLNWIDGLNGLSSGVSGIAALVMFILAARPSFHSVDQTAVIVMGLILAAVLLVFWFFDFYPAKILMGDTGTMFIGFILAGLALYSGGKLATAFLVLGFPIMDAFWVILRRIFNGTSPFKGDLQHFHHRLLYAGFTQRRALLLIYTVSAFFGLMALLLGSGGKIWAVIGLIAAMATLGLLVVLLEVEKTRKRG